MTTVKLQRLLSIAHVIISLAKSKRKRIGSCVCIIENFTRSGAELCAWISFVYRPVDMFWTDLDVDIMMRLTVVSIPMDKYLFPFRMFSQFLHGCFITVIDIVVGSSNTTTDTKSLISLWRLLMFRRRS